MTVPMHMALNTSLSLLAADRVNIDFTASMNSNANITKETNTVTSYMYTPVYSAQMVWYGRI